ncbi:hypothetical protein PLANTIT3_80044 [Plantibacter sp. T3]|nr:hypothetical protein PLANTIT3_80044 [Plantibacter sp. T3]
MACRRGPREPRGGVRGARRGHDRRRSRARRHRGRGACRTVGHPRAARRRDGGRGRRRRGRDRREHGARRRAGGALRPRWRQCLAGLHRRARGRRPHDRCRAAAAAVVHDERDPRRHPGTARRGGVDGRGVGRRARTRRGRPRDDRPLARGADSGRCPMVAGTRARPAGLPYAVQRGPGPHRRAGPVPDAGSSDRPVVRRGPGGPPGAAQPREHPSGTPRGPRCPDAGTRRSQFVDRTGRAAPQPRPHGRGGFRRVAPPTRLGGGHGTGDPRAHRTPRTARVDPLGQGRRTTGTAARIIGRPRPPRHRLGAPESALRLAGLLRLEAVQPHERLPRLPRRGPDRLVARLTTGSWRRPQGLSADPPPR